MKIASHNAKLIKKGQSSDDELSKNNLPITNAGFYILFLQTA